jgi:glycerol-3-phosphate acyltransferase PlsY
MSFIQILFIALAYLSGAVPYGYLITRKSTGLNILEEGSGNIGSTNVGRVAGRKVALKVQLLDMLKGLFPVAIVSFINNSETSVFPDYFIYLVAFSTIIGHNFSVFLRFRGGKGVNTTLGASVMLAPIEVFCAIGIYFLVKKIFKYTSIGSIALALTMPATGLVLSEKNWLLIYLLLCCIMILVRHTSNIKRLISGKEML